MLIGLIHRLEKLYKPFSNDLKLTLLQLRQIMGVPDDDPGNSNTNFIVAFDLLKKQGRLIPEGKYYKWVA